MQKSALASTGLNLTQLTVSVPQLKVCVGSERDEVHSSTRPGPLVANTSPGQEMGEEGSGC